MESFMGEKRNSQEQSPFSTRCKRQIGFSVFVLLGATDLVSSTFRCDKNLSICNALYGNH